jgi:predicted nuclease with RNAse H fold
LGLSRATKGRTVAAHVTIEDPLRLVELVTIRPGLRDDIDLIDWIRHRRPVVVGIDAPLSLPHSVSCEANDCERCEPGQADYMARDVDRMAGGMPTVMLAAIAFRGMYLARLLRSIGLDVIEVYPGATYSAWGLKSLSY